MRRITCRKGRDAGRKERRMAAAGGLVRLCAWMRQGLPVAAALLAVMLLGSCSGAVERARRNIRFEGVESVEVHGLSSLELSLRATNDTRRNLRLREADFDLYWGGNRVARVVLMEEVTLPRRTTGCIATRWRVRVDDPLTFYVAARRIGRGDVDRATVSWHVRGRYGVASANLSQEKVPLSDFLRNFGLSVDDLIKLF